MAAMEDVLDLYAEPYDPDRPVVCFDETSTQLLADTRPPIPVQPGQPRRQDYEYRRGGTRNIFLTCEPLAGWRHVAITERRTMQDFAHQMRWLVDEAYPDAQVVRLGQMAATLPERIALARCEQLDYASFLEIIFSDEVNRRAHRRIEVRLNGAGFEETCRLEDFDWSASITLDRRLLDAVFSLEFLDKHEHILLVGPAGVGKSFLAQALGYSAVRAGHTVRFSHAADFFNAMAQARVDNSVDRAFRSFLTPDLLILDDLGLHRLTAQQSADLYELILNRHRSSSFIITSNRAVEEWLSLFDDPILGNSALDRLANASYQIVIEGTSYRERLSPHRALLSNQGGD